MSGIPQPMVESTARSAEAEAESEWLSFVRDAGIDLVPDPRAPDDHLCPHDKPGIRFKRRGAKGWKERSCGGTCGALSPSERSQLERLFGSGVCEHMRICRRCGRAAEVRVSTCEGGTLARPAKDIKQCGKVFTYMALPGPSRLRSCCSKCLKTRNASYQAEHRKRAKKKLRARAKKKASKGGGKR